MFFGDFVFVSFSRKLGGAMGIGIRKNMKLIFISLDNHAVSVLDRFKMNCPKPV